MQIKFFKGNYQDPVFFSMVPLQGAVEREIARYYWNQVGGPFCFPLCVETWLLGGKSWGLGALLSGAHSAASWAVQRHIM